MKKTIDYTKARSTDNHIDKICESSVAYLAEEYRSASFLKKMNGTYTLEDYYNLPSDVRAELIDGHLIFMDAPTLEHQDLSGEIHYQIKDYIKKHHGKCRVWFAPVDVLLDSDDQTVVQPDVLIVCDDSKLDGRRINGAPDFVLEVLSPSSRSKDTIIKLNKYRDAGVKEYWIVDPETKTVSVHLFTDNKEHRINQYNFDEPFPLSLFDELYISF